MSADVRIRIDCSKWEWMHACVREIYMWQTIWTTWILLTCFDFSVFELDFQYLFIIYYDIFNNTSYLLLHAWINYTLWISHKMLWMMTQISTRLINELSTILTANYFYFCETNFFWNFESRILTSDMVFSHVLRKSYKCEMTSMLLCSDIVLNLW